MDPRAQRVGELLTRATQRLHGSGSESARLDAEVLLGHVLGIDRSALAAHPETILSTGQLDAYESCLERRSAGEPVAYIRGLKEFYGVVISVDPRVLIPRPATEALVDLAVERVRADLTGAPQRAGDDPYLVWDVGAGSGAIAVAIATELRRRRYGDAVRFYVSDVSEDAVAVATINAVAHGLADHFTFARGDLTDVTRSPPSVDLLVANLPYIPSGSIADLPVAASYEPLEALDGGADGMVIIKRLLPQLPRTLADSGVGLLEMGGDQGAAMTKAAAELLPGWSCSIHADLSGSPRVAQLQRSDA